MQITKDDIIAYTEGDCWVLAYTLWHATRCNPVLVAWGDEGAAQSGQYTSWVHMGVRLPDGRILDIEGVHDDEDSYIARWFGTAQDDSEGKDSNSVGSVFLWDLYDLEEYEEATRGMAPEFAEDEDHIQAVAEHLVTLVAEH